MSNTNLPYRKRGNYLNRSELRHDYGVFSGLLLGSNSKTSKPAVNILEESHNIKNKILDERLDLELRSKDDYINHLQLELNEYVSLISEILSVVGLDKDLAEKKNASKTLCLEEIKSAIQNHFVRRSGSDSESKSLEELQLEV